MTNDDIKAQMMHIVPSTAMSAPDGTQVTESDECERMIEPDSNNH